MDRDAAQLCLSVLCRVEEKNSLSSERGKEIMMEKKEQERKIDGRKKSRWRKNVS